MAFLLDIPAITKVDFMRPAYAREKPNLIPILNFMLKPNFFKNTDLHLNDSQIQCNRRKYWILKKKQNFIYLPNLTNLFSTKQQYSFYRLFVVCTT